MKKKHLPFVSCIIPAAGSGKRMKSELNKIFLDLNGIPILAHTLSAFEKTDAVREIIIVAAEQDMPGCMDIAKEFGITKLKTITKGGAERQDSVTNGLAELSLESEIVLIHDGARPLVSQAVIDSVIVGVMECGAAATGVPCKNTLKIIDECNNIVDTPNRSHLWEVQTPQGFSKDVIIRAYQHAREHSLSGTDDCFLAEQIGTRVRLISGDYENIKITTPEDLLFAELLLENRRKG